MTIFSHQNYREYLKQYYEAKKQTSLGFTYATFAKSAGLGSPNYLKLVIDGQKNLTPQTLLKFAKALQLNETEREYFEALVHFNQAKNKLEKEYHQSRLSKLRSTASDQVVNERTLEEYEFELISHWLFHAVLVMTNLRYFKEDPQWMSQQLYGLASPDEVASVLQKLQALGLLVRTKEGKLIQSKRQIKTKPELKGLAVQNFYKGLLQRAAHFSTLNKIEDGAFGSYVVGASAEQIPEMKRRVREFLQSLNEFALENNNPKQVYALSFFGFPLTKD